MGERAMSCDEEREKLLTTNELAQRWGIHKVTLATWRRQNKGPKYVKLGEFARSPILYRLSDVVEYENQFLVKTKN